MQPKTWVVRIVWVMCLVAARPAGATSSRVLPNGVKVWVEEDPTAGPLLGIWVDVAVGAGAETTGWAGAAHLIEHLRARELPGPPARRTAWTTTEETHFESIGLLSDAVGLIQVEVHRQQPWALRFLEEDLPAALAAERAVMRLELLAREPARREEAALRQRLFPGTQGADPLGPDGRPEQDIGGFTPEALHGWEAALRGNRAGGGLTVHLRAAVPEAQLLAWGEAFGAIQVAANPSIDPGGQHSAPGPASGPSTPGDHSTGGSPGWVDPWLGPGPKGCTVAFAIPGEGHPDLGMLRALALAWNNTGRRVWTDVGAEVGVFFVRWDRPCPRGPRALPRARGPHAKQLSAWENRRAEEDFVWRGRAASACRPPFATGGVGMKPGVAMAPGQPGIGPGVSGLACAQAANQALHAGAEASPAALREVAERWLDPQLGQWGWR